MFTVSLTWMDVLPLDFHNLLHFPLEVHHAEWELPICASIFLANHEAGCHVSTLYPYRLTQNL